MALEALNPNTLQELIRSQGRKWTAGDTPRVGAFRTGETATLRVRPNRAFKDDTCRRGGSAARSVPGNIRFEKCKRQ
jgi:hypothetical protein